ncbi:MAG: RNA polymerase factor sigma-54 [Alphaproteobacteria bacterium]|nr:RNA polymerase factor sigma-54 [Alphaproteobacteria bacterium]
MALGQRLDFRQSQQLVMTPQLQQAIKLLQLSNLELGEFVEAELERNPLLERDESGDRPVEQGLGIDGDPGGAEIDPNRQDAADLTRFDGMIDGASGGLDQDTENLWSSGESQDYSVDSGLADWKGTGGRQSFDLDERGLEETLSTDKTLSEHLADQVLLDVTDPVDRLIASHLIDMIDETGWFLGDLAPIAEQLSCPEDRVEATLGRLQLLDPPGIFARSLAECMELQLRDRNRWDPCMAALVQNLDRLAKRDFAGLRKLCKVDEDELVEMIQEIRTLDPKPGLQFLHVASETMIPDVFVRAGQDGQWHVELNTDNLPKVLVNQRYYATVTKGARTKDDKEYISEQFQSANWLVKSLHQRATTILKVSSEIVRQQDLFFHYGVQNLRPLVLRDVADAIGMHESTVSRVTTNKYLASPRGTYELKFFFTAALGGEGGITHSAEAVRDKIKNLIDGEDPKKILSDDKIVDILRAEGVDIARRTVAKYREAMKIPSSVQRRRDKNLGR